MKDKNKRSVLPFGEDDFYRDGEEGFGLDSELVEMTNVKEELEEALTPEEARDVE